MLDKKTDKEIKILQEGGRILGGILKKLASEVKVGVTGLELNNLAEKLIKEAGGEPSFKNYQGFPNALCVSVNETVVHGIPTNKPFVEGDLVGLDLGLKYQGLYTDSALTVPVGKVSSEAQKLLEATKKALELAISEIKPNNHIGDIGKAVEAYIKPLGYGIVKDLAGHGVGREVHENPYIPNFDTGKQGDKMFPGLVLAIEPMLILSGEDRIKTKDNGWDADSYDNSLTAHFEHTVVVTAKGNLILTK